MRIQSGNRIINLILEWHDIDALKAGNLVAERFDGEHKCNLSCVPETHFVENWTETGSVIPITKFDTFLHDFFIQIPVFDVRNQFIASRTLALCPNPFFKTVKIIFPE